MAEKVQFPELDKAVAKLVNDLSVKNVEVFTMKNEVDKITKDLYAKTVLITEKTELTCFTQLCLADKNYYTPLEINRISMSNIELCMDYLEKETPG